VRGVGEGAKSVPRSRRSSRGRRRQQRSDVLDEGAAAVTTRARGLDKLAAVV